LTHTRAPTGAIGITRLRTCFAGPDVLRTRSTLITGFRHSRDACAWSVLQNVPFATIHGILVAIGEGGETSSHTAIAVDTGRSRIWETGTRMIA
jgi:hypothetical protein